MAVVRGNENVSQMPSACAECPIVLVDDETTFRVSLAEALRDDGHEVFDYLYMALLRSGSLTTGPRPDARG